MKKSFITLGLLFVLGFSFFCSFAQTQLLQQSKLNQSYWSLAHWGNFLAGSRYGSYQLDILDNMNPDNPTILKQHTLESSLNTVESFSSKYLLLGFNQKLSVMNIENPLTPVETAVLSMTGEVQHIAFYGTSLFVTTSETNGTYKLHKVSINNSGTPALINATTFNNKIGKLIIKNNYAYLLETKQNTATLYNYEIQTGNVLNIINIMPLPIPFTDIKMGGNTLYLNSTSKMVLYDITNPANLALKKEVTISAVNGFAAVNSSQFVMIYINRMEWRDANNSSTQSFPTGELPVSVNVINQNIYYCTTGGTYILSVDAISSLPDLSAGIQLRSFPNPAQDTWTLSTSELKEDAYRLTLTNVNGSVVYTVVEESGRDIVLDNHFPAGIYFYTLENRDGIVAKGKMISQR